MTKSLAIENSTASVVLLGIAVEFWRPEWRWLHWAIIGVLFLGIALSAAVASRLDQERRRLGAWLMPVVMFVVAAQLAYFAAPDERARVTVLGSGLVLAGLALSWIRRRAT